jgi:hypothetical protein
VRPAFRWWKIGRSISGLFHSGLSDMAKVALPKSRKKTEGENACALGK